MLVEGLPAELRRDDGSFGTEIIRLLDFNDPEANNWLVVNQFVIKEDHHQRRPDILLFVNGIPLAIIELKDASDENADIWKAFNQIQTYKVEIPSLFTANAIAVISDGLTARVGTISADRERFMPWRSIDGERLSPPTMLELGVGTPGAFEKKRVLHLVRHFILF